MKTFIHLLCTLLFLSSCSLFKDPKREKILAAWKGRPVQELNTHPFFANVPLKLREVEGENELRNYEERGKYMSGARSQALGGGLGIPTEVCQNIFTIKKGIIQQYVMKESCLTNPEKAPID